MTRRWITVTLLALALGWLGVAQAAPVEEMHRTDKLMTEHDNETGDIYLLTKLKSLLACERLQDQASKGHCVIVDAANLAVISKTTAVTIGGGVANDTYLKRVIVLAALTGTCVFTGFADSDGVAQSFTIPSAFVGERNFGGAKNSAGALTVTCSNASDDNLVLVEWWPAS